MTEPTLKPCPFCGDTDADIYDDVSGDVFFRCQNCQAEGPPTRVGCREPDEVTDEQLEQEAAELWNGRIGTS